ncbi:MAG: hypothetical protein AVDCRST_MAG48-1308, partial [uncultured Friedmanniella sp.]
PLLVRAVHQSTLTDALERAGSAVRRSRVSGDAAADDA